MDLGSLLLASSTSAAMAGLSSAADFFWGNPIFESKSWSDLMNGLRIALTLSGAFLLLYEARATKLGATIRERTKRRVAILFSALAFLAYFDFFNPNVRYSEYYHRHEFFHYYLGSKYSQEIGYKLLYECSAVAEVELGRGSQVMAREVRDLRVNLIKPIRETLVAKNPNECKKRFTPERWASWKKDVDWFYKSSAGSYWDNMQKDHGYNPPPVWTMAGKFFSSFGDASDAFFKALSALDVLLHVGMVLLFYWAFGWRVMAIATVFWGCNAPANFYWTGGAFMRQDWIFFLVASVCLARKRKFALAGAALTWSSLLRVFPVIFFAGYGAIILLHLVRKRFLRPEHKQLIIGSVIAAGVLIPASVIVAGPNSYKEFVQHTLAVHKNTPLTNTMGLETMLVHDWNGRMRFTRDDTLDDPFQEWKQGRIDRGKAMKPLQLAIVLGLGLWMLWALRRTKLLWVGPPLAVGLLCGLVNVTCYYYSFFMIGAALVKVRRELGAPFLLVSGASQILLLRYYWVDDKYNAQSWLFFLMAVLFLLAYSRPFSIERLKAWWQGRPEPKSPPRLAPADSAAE
jgi:hypothetical protein